MIEVKYQFADVNWMQLQNERKVNFSKVEIQSREKSVLKMKVIATAAKIFLSWRSISCKKLFFEC